MKLLPEKALLLVLITLLLWLGCTGENDVITSVDENTCCDSLIAYRNIVSLAELQMDDCWDSLAYYKQYVDSTQIYKDSLYMFKPETCIIDSSYYWWPGDPYSASEPDTLRIFRGCGEPDSIFIMNKHGLPPSPGGIPGN